jgi:hypothetical protein
VFQRRFLGSIILGLERTYYYPLLHLAPRHLVALYPPMARTRHLIAATTTTIIIIIATKAALMVMISIGWRSTVLASVFTQCQK